MEPLKPVGNFRIDAARDVAEITVEGDGTTRKVHLPLRALLTFAARAEQAVLSESLSRTVGVADLIQHRRPAIAPSGVALADRDDGLGLLVLLDPASEGELIVALDYASARALAEQMLARCDAADGN
jgi:hypothetical protein